MSKSNLAGWSGTDVADTCATSEQFLEVTDLLLENVQLNSTHLFRADILHDSLGRLQTITEKEQSYHIGRDDPVSIRAESDDSDAQQTETQVKHAEGENGLKGSPSYDQNGILGPPAFVGFDHYRTVLRRLIPRKPQLDKALEQSCFIYLNENEACAADAREVLVVYMPHCRTPDLMPWYHPNVKGVAYKFSTSKSGSTLSVHYLPFPDAPVSDRIERTMLSLLKTSVRLLKMPSKAPDVEKSELADDISRISLAASALKDTILPQHIVQDTYTRLKQKYAPDLIARWVESTEPSKHVFEDISIAAFLIELWTTMYDKSTFIGFADVACGNGVLTYILTREGWRGQGFDARRRKTWDFLDIEDCLEEAVCIPQPFIDESDQSDLIGLNIHNGIFPEGTFIISNHADELTCWTPILAALSRPSNPLPFLAIPCCSHALDGSKHRYTLKEVAVTSDNEAIDDQEQGAHADRRSNQKKAETGDLKALRAQKQAMHSHSDPGDKSMYGCLTRKTAALAKELKSGVELTLMRIPSTRNIGIAGNRKMLPVAADTEVRELIRAVLDRECARTGGLRRSAQTWIERARKLQEGQGRGKVNWNGPRS